MLLVFQLLYPVKSRSNGWKTQSIVEVLIILNSKLFTETHQRNYAGKKKCMERKSSSWKNRKRKSKTSPWGFAMGSSKHTRKVSQFSCHWVQRPANHSLRRISIYDCYKKPTKLVKMKETTNSVGMKLKFHNKASPHSKSQHNHQWKWAMKVCTTLSWFDNTRVTESYLIRLNINLYSRLSNTQLTST